MQNKKSKNSIYLSEYFNPDELFQFFKVFPELKPCDFNLYSNSKKLAINKFAFYKMLLEKIKNYFQINQMFIISESISIILKDINSIINQDSEKTNILPIINNRYSNDNLGPNKNFISTERKNKRNFSSKSNGKNKINEKIKSKTNYSFFEKQKEKNHIDINKIYLNLEQPKQKFVHFKNESDSISNISHLKKHGKKSNLKNNVAFKIQLIVDF